MRWPEGEPLVLAVPPLKPEPPEPSFTKTSATATHESVGSVAFEGENLKAVKRVTFEDAPLLFEVSQDGKKLTVHLTRKVTEKPGVSVECLARGDDEVIQVLTIAVTPKKTE